ncbi:hypothetical protein M441DRAFT_58951 [Trichoderma asperellum CBS 433.97]|uniref:Uncharacterized protein n=1 Tax=Trichoderma asperellum (strain ATCC 204424 / CBS 433.97 / NBRC 101777) TaxID=1042311 RepID=A0A2T3Z5R7_TRIA4|nr:hypothetical protein M441DRAFT_58951 [Trichoderma asperellum CBS 433.97]PTB40134.1 hypothetical protein M441DRAFT_58951 [Trichoderma asperellum CBS 433.97]
MWAQKATISSSPLREGKPARPELAAQSHMPEPTPGAVFCQALQGRPSTSSLSSTAYSSMRTGAH